MDRKTYDDYLVKFNARDYDGVLDYFAPKFEISFAGYRLRSREEVLNFYGFLHAHIIESIGVHRFVSNDETIALEARVRLEGRRDLTPQALSAAGFGRLVPLRAGEIVEIPQFIHYHLAGGKFVKALCAVFEEPRGG